MAAREPWMETRRGPAGVSLYLSARLGPAPEAGMLTFWSRMQSAHCTTHLKDLSIQFYPQEVSTKEFMDLKMISVKEREPPDISWHR